MTWKPLRTHSYLVTVKGILLVRVLVEVDTDTMPEVTPAGTVATISVSETTLNDAAVPLKLTLVDPVK